MSLLFQHDVTPAHAQLEKFSGGTQCRSIFFVQRVTSASSYGCLVVHLFIKSGVKDRFRSGYQEHAASAVKLPVGASVAAPEVKELALLPL